MYYLLRSPSKKHSSYNRVSYEFKQTQVCDILRFRCAACLTSEQPSDAKYAQRREAGVTPTRGPPPHPRHAHSGVQHGSADVTTRRDARTIGENSVRELGGQPPRPECRSAHRRRKCVFAQCVHLRKLRMVSWAGDRAVRAALTAQKRPVALSSAASRSPRPLIVCCSARGSRASLWLLHQSPEFSPPVRLSSRRWCDR